MLRAFRAIAVLCALAMLAPTGLAAQTSDPFEYPDVRAVKVVVQPGGAFDFAVTMTSPYDTPQRYADGFRVTGADGTVYGEMKLAHDHATEQPFTRTLTGVAIPPGVREVIVQGRDQKNGYGGLAVKTALPGR